MKRFLKACRYDLYKNVYDEVSYKEYIYGSAESVGLMCLSIFCAEDKALFMRLKEYACSLGAAFQKVNFLRDIKADHELLDRVYFPNCNFKNFSNEEKKQIEADIQKDFEHAYKGILQLPAKRKIWCICCL